MPKELLLITVLCLFVAPSYFIFLIFFRDGVFFPEYLSYNKHVKKIEESKISQEYKSVYNPYVLSCIFLFISFVILAILLTIFYLIVTRDLTFTPLKKGDLFVLVGLFLSNMILFFGVGVYVVSITVANLKSSIVKLKKAGVNTKKILTYRGSISHVAMFTGTGFSFLLLSFLENWNTHTYLSFFMVFLCIINGVTFGVLLGLSQVYSGTWKHQFPVVVFCFLIQSYLFFNVAEDIFYYPFTIFSYFAITTVFVVDLYLLFKYITGKISYKYD